MKDKKFLANLDRDTVCFLAAMMILAGVGATVSLGAYVAENRHKDSGEVKQDRDSLENCDETHFDGDLPPRTNMGDTLYVLGNKSKNSNCVVAVRPDGTQGTFRFQGANKVNPGDTVIVNLKHKFLMKNITQQRLEKQK